MIDIISILTPKQDFDATSSAVTACLDICVRMDPFGEVVNSVIVGRVK
jgi:nicotianamine synthase